MDQERQQGRAVSTLTERERAVLQMVAEGMSNKEMAARFGIAPKTVEHYRAQVMLKLDLHDVAALTRQAVRMGLVTVEVEGRALLEGESDWPEQDVVN
jgi:DNA-binding NarL/FixJ family response regulator